MLIGAQLFTLRDCCQTTDGLADALKRVADIGYTAVQVSGTCAYEPEWLAEQLAQNGLRCVLTHTATDRLQNEPDKVAADHRLFGCSHIGIGCAPNALKGGEPDFETLCRLIDAAAPALTRQNCQLMYHNHQFEFERVNGVTYFDRLIARYTPQQLGFTLDTYWVQVGGRDPAAQIRALKGRVPCVHLKDLAICRGEVRMAPVGAGNLDFDRILSAAAESDTQYLLVEQDDCYGADPFDCLKQSYQYLKAKGL